MLLTLNLAFLITCAACAVFDYLTFKIPNKFILVLIALFAVRTILLMSLPELTDHLIIGGVTLLSGFLLYVLKIIGAGDAKFLTACMLWVAPANIITFLLATTIAGAILALIYLPLEKKINSIRQNGVSRIMTYPWGNAFLKEKLSTPHLGKDRVGKGLIPYGVAIFSGVLCTSIITKGNF